MPSCANTKYAIIRKHPDGHIEFKTSLSTYLGQWSKELIYTYLDVDPSQLKAALTKEKKQLEKIRQISKDLMPYQQKASHIMLYQQEASTAYKYYLVQVQLSYNIDLAQPL